MTCSWKIVEFTPRERGTLKGFLKVKIGTLIVHGFSLHIQEQTGTRWIGVPQREYLLSGKRSYSPIVEFVDPEAKQAFQRWALAELDHLPPAAKGTA